MGKPKVPSAVFPKHSLMELFCLRKLRAISYSLAHVDIWILVGYDNEIKNLNFRSDLRYILIYTNSICNNTLHDLTLLKMTVLRFVGTGNFLEVLSCVIKRSPIQKVHEKYLK